MTRERLERHQVWCYLATLALGLTVGTLWPAVGETVESLVWPTLALLLYATFTQTPLTSIPTAFRDGRFLLTALLGNFVIIPAVVWGLVAFAPPDDALRLGLLLVLLVPCTDWFITFSQLGRGDATRATALTPVSLLLQLLLLPAYLWLMSGAEFTTVFTPGQVWPALLVVLVPLGLAALTEFWSARRPEPERIRQRLGWWPVPLLSVVIFLVAAAHVRAARASIDLLPPVVAIAAAFLAASLIVARILATIARMPAAQGRTLAFSLGTRNSFIVLPFALALPAGWEIAALVIVVQSLVELFGMIFCLWFVPRILFPDRPASPTS
ncbi:arsenic resistance protein [Natronosporangium hydrolyticum]|uniref:Arsenic resistance protein n=1 Tax=Natronosporangium hydrolyticum TaxID=2811111 RepID=A0A895YL78_9ACTN|nr:hypothetical protein [Natronosporangium hydrolyticum]QSB14618.1 arsenic resistance protein [Natronosporangium hydrolyticum]